MNIFSSNSPQSIVLFPPAGIGVPKAPGSDQKKKEIKRKRAAMLVALALVKR